MTPLSADVHLPNPASLGLSSFVHLSLYLTLIVLCRFCYRYVEQDYQKFLALGPGGTPYSFRGYTQLAFIGLFRLRNPLRAPAMPPRLHLKKGFLEDLKPRLGRRPELVGMAPQRQISQNCSKAMIQTLQSTIRAVADECPSHLHVATSRFEKHNEALFSRCMTFTEPGYGGEIVHSHSSDGSMHIVLHPEDIKMVLERGWGERHPLAWGGPWWWRAPVPCGFMIIYAPRNEAELQQVKSIIRAAAWWVGGVDLRLYESKAQNGGVDPRPYESKAQNGSTPTRTHLPSPLNCQSESRMDLLSRFRVELVSPYASETPISNVLAC